MLHGLGYLSYTIPLLAAGKVFQIFRSRRSTRSSSVWLLRLLGFFLSVLSLAALSELSIFSSQDLPAGIGGMVGQGIASITVSLFSTIGGGILLTLALCIGLMLFWEFSWLAVFDAVGRYLLSVFAWFQCQVKNTIEKMKRRRARGELVPREIKAQSSAKRIEPGFSSKAVTIPAIKAAPPIIMPKAEEPV